MFDTTPRTSAHLLAEQLETGGSTTATVLVDCLFLFLIPGTDMHLVPVMAVGKVYSNSEARPASR